MTTNDYKWAKIVFYLSRDAFLHVYDVNFGPDCDFIEI